MVGTKAGKFRWIEGSLHEVPFRLTYIEKKAERNPDGLWARGLDLVAELRDMLTSSRGTL